MLPREATHLLTTPSKTWLPVRKQRCTVNIRAPIPTSIFIISRLTTRRILHSPVDLPRPSDPVTKISQKLNSLNNTQSEARAKVIIKKVFLSRNLAAFYRKTWIKVLKIILQVFVVPVDCRALIMKSWAKASSNTPTINISSSESKYPKDHHGTTWVLLIVLTCSKILMSGSIQALSPLVSHTTVEDRVVRIMVSTVTFRVANSEQMRKWT